MNFLTFLPYVAAVLSVALAVFIIVRDRRSFVHRSLAGGLVLLSLEAVATGFGLMTSLPAEILSRQNMRLIVTSFLPGVWLLFALTYLRTNHRDILLKWRWAVLAAFVVPIALSTLFRKSFFVGDPIWNASLGWMIPLGRPGIVFHIGLLLSAILILMNLERALRASVGHMRWQIKYMLLGVGSIFGVWIYTASQAILFQSVNTGLLFLNSGALLIADALILRSILRADSFGVAFYPSRSLLYKSFTVFVVGIYLLVTGVLAKLIQYLNGGSFLYMTESFIFLALLCLSIGLLSDRVRHRVKHLISIDLKRPQFDYQKEWMKFTEKTSTIIDIRELCTTVSGMISNVLDFLSVTIWLLDDSRTRLRPFGSTDFPETGAGDLISEEAGRKLLQAIADQEMPVDLGDPKFKWAHGLKDVLPDSARKERLRYGMRLSAGGNLLGVITLGEKIEHAAFSFEERRLVKTIADQTAGSILNLKFSEDLRKRKEMETVQAMSSFFVHDLKNLASALSLTVQNLPTHFDNPEFRNDALAMMKKSVNKIDGMCRNLSIIGKRIELRKTETDLNELIKSSVSCLNGSVQVAIVQNLQPMVKLMVDPEQVQKVLTNLVLNAKEAVGEKGEIRIVTGQENEWAIFSIDDNGCGMSKEFMEKSLFHPFKTTKKKGMGIGLFQSKMIIEAHQGRIEVESEQGKGTTFRVMLPLKT